MTFNVTLNKEQIDEIASVTADKVLATVKYHRDNENWYERQIEELKHAVSKRDSMIVQRDLLIDRLREKIDKLKNND